MDFLILVGIVLLLFISKKGNKVSHDRLQSETLEAYKNGFRDGKASVLGVEDE